MHTHTHKVPLAYSQVEREGEGHGKTQGQKHLDLRNLSSYLELKQKYAQSSKAKHLAVS